MATTTSMLKTTSTTSVLVALAFMNSTMSNTTKLHLPVTNTIDTQPNCFRQQIECPFPLPAVKNVSADVRPQIVDKPVSSSTTPALQLITTGANSSAVMDFGHSSDFSRNSNVGPPTTGLFSSNRNVTSWTESTTETTFKTVDDVRITAEVVYDDETSSSEDTTTTADPDVSYTHSYDEMIENPTVGLVTAAESMTENSTIDLVTAESTITSSTDVSFDFESTIPESSSSSTESELGETMLSESVESTTRMVTESTLSLDAAVMMANTTIDQPIITTIDDNDEPYSTTSYDDLQFWRADERIVSSKERRIVKRMAELIFNGTHCFQIVCSSPSPVTNVTEVPKGFQGFSEESSK